MASRIERARWAIVRPLFEALYTNRTLYWLASTIPFAGQWRVWQRLVLPRLTGRDVLEVGCGIGALLADMVQAGYHCVAIDRSPQMAAAARQELRSRALDLAATPIIQARVQALPFAGASFDSVVSTFPTEYIYDPATTRELARVLRPGGRVIVVLGATLLPAHLALLPLVALQRLVYGRAAPPAPDAPDAADPPVTIPFTSAGLVARSELVRGPFWLAYLVIAEKPQ